MVLVCTKEIDGMYLVPVSGPDIAGTRPGPSHPLRGWVFSLPQFKEIKVTYIRRETNLKQTYLRTDRSSLKWRETIL